MNFRSNLDLNREHDVLIDLSDRYTRDKFKPALVCLQIGSNDLCSLDVHINDLVDKIFEFMVMLKTQCAEFVYTKFYTRTPPPTHTHTTRGRVSINFKWFNTNVNIINSLFGERLCRDFCQGSDAGVQLVIGY